MEGNPRSPRVIEDPPRVAAVNQRMSASIKRRLPEIIGAGPGRTGSTWLHRVPRGPCRFTPMALKRRSSSAPSTTRASIGTRAHFSLRDGTAPGSPRFAPTTFFKDRGSGAHQDPHSRLQDHHHDARIRSNRLYSKYKLVRHSAGAPRGTLEETLNAWPSMGSGNRYALPSERLVSKTSAAKMFLSRSTMSCARSRRNI